MVDHRISWLHIHSSYIFGESAMSKLQKYTVFILIKKKKL